MFKTVDDLGETCDPSSESKRFGKFSRKAKAIKGRLGYNIREDRCDFWKLGKLGGCCFERESELVFFLAC